jgi:DNA gyrase subunit A
MMSDLELLHNQEEVINEDTELVISEESAEIISDILSENDKAQSVEEIEEIKDKLYSYDNLPNALVHLVEGYLDYSKEVILERALPNIDGFKPSQRRILYAMKYLERDNDLTKDLTKCAGIAGTTMKIHPHGDASIYDTMVRMTDCALYLNTPFIKGKGSFGHVFSTDEKAAASRYTECMFTDVAKECFRGMNGIEMIPSYDNKLKEPLLLPVSYPSILCNTSQGIAVGISTNIPSFNFHEVNKATIEYIKTGEIKKALAPDFTTGGSYILNEHELKKLMETGNAKIKLRGKWHIEGKIIVIDEIPYYTTVEEIKNAVKDLPGVNDVKDECDRSGFRLTIECASKKLVDSVVNEVLRVSNLQMQITSNIVIIIDNKPRVIGVKEVIAEWVKFREGVLSVEIQKELDRLSALIERYDILVDLMTTDKRDPFLNTLLKDETTDYAPTKDLLRGYYPEVKDEIFDWILDRSLRSLKGVGNKQRNYLEELKAEKAAQEADLSDVRGRIVRELEELNKKYKFPRKTVITTEDITFDTVKKRKPEPVPVVVICNGMFIRKLKGVPSNAALEGAIKCMSDDSISYLDSTGRLLRVQLEDIDFNTPSEKGTYLPRYFEFENEFKILDIAVVANKKMGYMYDDGYIAVIDYNEWYSAKRKLKITEDGLAPKFIDMLVGRVRLDRGYIVIKTKKGKMAILESKFIEKKRTARTKLIRLGKDDKIVEVTSMLEENLAELFTDPERFKGALRVVNKKDGFNKEFYDKMVVKRR